MNLSEIIIKLKEKKLLLIMLVIGIAIMLIPGKADKKHQDNKMHYENIDKIETKSLERILNKISGVKSCNVFVTYENKGTNNFAYDVDTGVNRSLEIKMNDDEPLIESIKSPEIRGIFVYIEGARINGGEIVKIVKSATGAPMHRIFVKISEGK